MEWSALVSDLRAGAFWRAAWDIAVKAVALVTAPFGLFGLLAEKSGWLAARVPEDGKAAAALLKLQAWWDGVPLSTYCIVWLAFLVVAVVAHSSHKLAHLGAADSIDERIAFLRKTPLVAAAGFDCADAFLAAQIEFTDGASPFYLIGRLGDDSQLVLRRLVLASFVEPVERPSFGGREIVHVVNSDGATALRRIEAENERTGRVPKMGEQHG
jgi:hypothetical protein